MIQVQAKMLFAMLTQDPVLSRPSAMMAAGKATTQRIYLA
jgi:hypothetical protein